MLQLVRGANYLAGGLSDHTPLSVHISLPLQIGGGGSMEVEPGFVGGGVSVFSGGAIFLGLLGGQPRFNYFTYCMGCLQGVYTWTVYLSH